MAAPLAIEIHQDSSRITAGIQLRYGLTQCPIGSQCDSSRDSTRIKCDSDRNCGCDCGQNYVRFWLQIGRNPTVIRPEFDAGQTVAEFQPNHNRLAGER